MTTAWLIEWTLRGRPVWFAAKLTSTPECGPASPWTIDAAKAVWFVRRQDAETMLANLPAEILGFNIKSRERDKLLITEHGFVE